MNKQLLLIAICFYTLNCWAWNTPTITTPASPANGSDQWVEVTLDWGAVTNSQQYEVQIDTSMNFNSPLFQNEVENYINSSSANNDTHHTFDDLLFGETYYWRVRAWIAGDTSSWTVVRSFNVRDYVSLDSPNDNTDQWSGVTLDWFAHRGVDFYEVQVDTVTTFNSPVFQNDVEAYVNSSSANNDTEEFFSDLYFGATYYWRVRAISTIDTTEWSTVRSFNVRDFVSLDSPSDNTDQWSGLTLDWFMHYGVDFYEVQLDTVTTFNSSVFQNDVEAYINSSSANNDTEEYFSDLYFGATYYWRVRAINAVDTSEWSTVRSFNVRDFVTLDDPADNTDQWSGLTLDWYSHQGVDFYEIQVDTVTAFNSSVFQNDVEAYVNSSSANNDTEEYVSDLYFGSTYYWRVRAINAVDTTEWSTVRSFNVRDFVSLASPSDNSDQWSGLTLDWFAHHGVDFYEVQVDTVTGFNSPAFLDDIEAYINSSSANNDTEEYFSDLYFGSTYYWRVRAINAVDTTEWSTVWSFNVRDFVTLTSPSDNSDQWSGLTLDWYAHHGVDFYEVQVDTVTTFNSSVFQNDVEGYINSSSANNDTEEYFSDLYFGSTYHWRVRAINAVDTTEWSTVRSFNVRDFVTLDSPVDNSDQWSGLTLDWYAHHGVDFYEVQVDTVTGFNSPAFLDDMEAYINSSSANNDTEEYFSDLYFGSTYYWRIRAINAVDTTEWSTVRSFNVRDFVTLNSPADFTVNVSTAGINLDWNSHYGVDFYTLEWDTTNLFNSGNLQSVTEAYINSSSSNGDTQEISGTLDANQTYFWRVRAINAVDTSAWTSRVFSTGTGITVPQIPTLISPSNNSSVASTTVNFDWNDASNAQAYELEYSENINFISSTVSTPVVSQSNVSGLNNLTTYHWRVRSVNNGYYSDWSATWSFNVDSVACTSTSSTLDVTTCDSYTSPSGSTYTSSSSFVDMIPNAAGCDSLISINLTVNYSSVSTDVIDACGSHTWIDGVTYSSNNSTATYTVASSEGCDSVVTLNLTIQTVDNSTSVSGFLITSNEVGATYQWVDCNNNYLPISGETNQAFTATSNGDYAVVVTSANGCSDTSACIAITTISIDEVSLENGIIVSPNPTQGEFSISTSNYSGEIAIEVMDLAGKIIFKSVENLGPNSSANIDLHNAANGVYIVNVSDLKEVRSIRVIKN